MTRPVRRKRSTLHRLRPFWIVGVVVAGIAAWGGVAFAQMRAFQLQSLEVTGLSRVARSEVISRAAIDRHANVWLLDASAIAARVEQIPYVATARVHRLPLAKVWIEVGERTPDACVRDGAGRQITIDESLRVLQIGCARPDVIAFELRSALAAPPGSFVTNSAELNELESDARALGPGIGRFARLTHDDFGGLVAALRDGVVVKFGDDADLDQKQRLIGPILAELGPRAGNVRAVDLRAEATPVVEYRPPQLAHPHPLDKL